MRSLLAAVLLVASAAVHADEARSFTSIIRVQSTDPGAQSEPAGEDANSDSAPAEAACGEASLVDLVIALVAGGIACAPTTGHDAGA